jgi:hypothetical protein
LKDLDTGKQAKEDDSTKKLHENEEDGFKKP